MSDDVLTRAMERYAYCKDTWRELHARAREEDSFAFGNQWPEEVERERLRRGRPCLVINRLRSIIRRVVNDNRRNRPQLRVVPVDNRQDVATAEVINGLLKTITYCSNAELAYDVALEHAVTHGFGWIRVTTDYLADTFDQEVRIERVHDPYSVLVPIYLCKEYCFDDAPYLFVVKHIDKEQFRVMFPQANTSGWSGGAMEAGWVTDKTVCVAEYFEAVDVNVVLYLLRDGTVTREAPPDGSLVVKTRQTTERRWEWYLLTYGNVLDRREWPSRYHPFVPVFGEDVLLDGRRYYLSIVRHAMDAQRMYNYWRSAETEMIALAPKAPFVGARGQFEGFEAKWARANTENYAFLEYNPIVDATGQMVLPPPRRQDPPQIPTGYVNAAREAADDVKAVTGIFDASLGAIGTETSGIAIRNRQIQAEITNYHFADNLARAIRQVGLIVLDLIPVIYDTPRIVRILGNNGIDKTIEINKPTFDEEGKERFYKVEYGRYDLMVEVGPAYNTRREEAVANMIELLRSFPQMAAVIGDLVVSQMDFPGAQEIAERLQKMLPPQVLTDDKKRLPAEQEIASILDENQRLRQMLSDALVKLNDMAAERELKVDLAILDAETKIMVERLKRGGYIGEEELRAMRERYAQQLAPKYTQSVSVPAERVAEVDSGITSVPSGQAQTQATGDTSQGEGYGGATGEGESTAESGRSTGESAAQ